MRVLASAPIFAAFLALAGIGLCHFRLHALTSGITIEATRVGIARDVLLAEIPTVDAEGRKRETSLRDSKPTKKQR